MNVALIHDHLAQAGGAEKVLRILSDMYPEAPIYTLLCDQKNVDKYFHDRKIETSIIQRLPGGVRHYKWYMPFMPMAVEFFDLRNFDVVLSDASAFAKGVITPTDTLHICYCHTPTRYIWDYTHQYINELKYNRYFKKLISLVLNYIRIWDRLAADRADVIIANSRTVQKRIAKYYRRDSIVIYPPVDTGIFRVAEDVGDYFLIGGRLAAYKRIDIAIQAFKTLGYPLRIFGDGEDRERLMKLAQGADNIEFLGRVSRDDLVGLYSRARAFLNPQEEDFGITMVEAQASGRPVIAYGRGGATEIVDEGRTGLFFHAQSAHSLARAIQRFEGMNFRPRQIADHARQFSTERFQREIRDLIEREYEAFNAL